MSEENADVTTTITEFTNDFDKFSELVNAVDSYEKKFQKHLNELNKHQHLYSINNLIKNVFTNWTPLSQSVESVRNSLKKLNKPNNIIASDSEKSESPIKPPTTPTPIEPPNSKEIEFEDNITTEEKDKEASPEPSNLVVVSAPEVKVNKEKDVTGAGEEISFEQELERVLFEAEKESVVKQTEKKIENENEIGHETETVLKAVIESTGEIESAPVKEQIPEIVEKEVSKSTENGISEEVKEEVVHKSDESVGKPTPEVVQEPTDGQIQGKVENCDEETTSSCGKIRVVPIQKLLSTTPTKSEPLPPVTISDSDEDDLLIVTRSRTTRLKPQQIYELSDTDEEVVRPMTNKLKELLVESSKVKVNGLPNKSSSDKHIRIKYTPVRQPAGLALRKENRKRILISSDEEETVPILAKDTEPIKNSSEKETIISNNIEEKHIICDDGFEVINAAITEPLSSSPFQSEAFASKETVRTKSSNSDDFKKRCVVRIKRTSILTVHNTKSDALKSDSEANSSLNSLRKKFAFKMASDSDSEVDALPMNSESDETNSSDSEVVAPRKKRVFQEKSGSSSTTSDSDSNRTSTEGSTSARKKRKIMRKASSSSDSDGSGLDNSDANKKRKKIRKLINEKNLDDDTKRATKEEEERKRRIEERQKVYNQIYVKPENVEIEELILDFDEETKKPLLKVDDGLLKKLKPHQVNGVRFIWDACFETIKDCQEKPGSGCILAHCMGLGKTMQIVTLTHTLLTNSRVTHFERVLIISPLSTLNNWAREYHYWMSFAKNKDIEVYDMSKYKDKNMRAFKLEEWFTDGGVCIIGYDMYRILSNEKTKGLRKKQKEMLQRSLVDPGPDVVVCDEGHLLKNEKTSLSKAVTKMRTKRRIVLTGTPLQNNLKEYYCMIQFIKPNLLGTYKEYLNRFVNPITNGQYTDSTDRDIRLMKHRSHVLHKMLEACLQRRDYSVLAPYLPPKHEYVIFVTLSEVQKKLYGYYMTTQRDLIGEASGTTGKGAKLFQDFQDLRRIWTHPMNLRVNSDTVIRKKLARYDSEESMKDFIDDSDVSTESESDSSSSGEGDASEAKTVRTRNTRANKDLTDNDSDCLEVPTKDDPSEWWTRFVDDTELNNIHHSPKLVVLMTLLQRCEEIGDKVLVFSQSLQSLDVIEHFLSLIDRKTRGEEIEGDVGSFKGYWRPGVNYFRLDGSRTVENRESMCKSFNDRTNLNSRLFLISTRAGGLGINLVAANRVVIFDVSWNPSHDTQSIFRVYRFGQIKPCYIYRLIALGTMEQKVYERQVAKQATAKRVIDEQQISRHYNQSDLQELYTYELEPSSIREIPILPKDRLFAELLSKHEKLLFKYHEHDSLLENEDSENLTEEERKAAWAEYEAEKTRPPQPAMQYMAYDRSAYMANYGNPSGSVTSNKIFGFRSDILLRLLNMKGSQDHPELSSSQVIQLVPEYLQRLYFEMNNGDPTLYKELLELHKTLETPGGMYMNPLLFANQNPPTPVVHPFAEPVQVPPYVQVHPGTSNFNTSEVYEVD